MALSRDRPSSIASREKVGRDRSTWWQTYQIYGGNLIEGRIFVCCHVKHYNMKRTVIHKSVHFIRM